MALKTAPNATLREVAELKTVLDNCRALLDHATSLLKKVQHFVADDLEKEIVQFLKVLEGDEDEPDSKV